jgi:hypothetical protein
MSKNAERESLTLRIPKSLHGELVLKSLNTNSSVNNTVFKAIEEYLGNESLEGVVFQELERNSDQVRRASRQVEVLSEILLHLVQVWFLHTPFVDDPKVREAMRIRSHKQMGPFMKAVEEAALSHRFSEQLWEAAFEKFYRDFDE